MRDSVSIALILVFLMPLASPLFSGVDDCRIMCHRLKDACCESEMPLDKACPSLVRGRDAVRVFLPVAPMSAGPKFHLFPVISAGSFKMDSQMSEARLGNLWFHSFSLPPKVPPYFLTHSLLI